MRIVAGAEPATGSSPADAATAADIGSAAGKAMVGRYRSSNTANLLANLRSSS
jgi:hypothetical protein